MNTTTTLDRIKAHGPCQDGWVRLTKALGRETGKVTLQQILDSNGVKDMVWALRAVDGIEREARLFACWMAQCVLPLFEEKYPDDDRPRRAIETAERFAEGQATKEEMAAAWDAASGATSAATSAAARSAASASAAWDAASAAWDAASAASAAWGVAWEASAAWGVAWEAAWYAACEAAWYAASAAAEKWWRAVLAGAEPPAPYEFWKEEQTND